MITSREPQRQRGGENVERLLDEGPRVGLKCAKERHVDLQDDFGACHRPDEAANVDVGALLGLVSCS